MENISEHIFYKEAVYSVTAKARGIDNTPSESVLKNMRLTAVNVFEPVRKHFGRPIKVSSFYRCAALNKAIGGSPTSQHVTGQAIDMDGDVFGSPSNKQIFEFIRDNLSFDQLIVEGIHDGKMDWVHCSYKPEGNRKQILLMYTQNGKKVYEPYSLSQYSKLIK
jgi:zinc D-Ala-D-Ala carboxypeptidase